ncbi:MAG: EamA family transporter [Bacteroidales bacterium]|nr:EamA family transporter [Bacteroidales bacterium]
MSFRLLLLVAIQALFLAGGQVLLKKAMVLLPAFSWSWTYFKAVAQNWWFALCGVSFGVATVLWLYILKHFPFSQAYPLTALGYVFGMVAALLVFGEQIPMARWIGVVLIVAGCFFIMK